MFLRNTRSALSSLLRIRTFWIPLISAWQVGQLKNVKLIRLVLHRARRFSLRHSACRMWPQASYKAGFSFRFVWQMTHISLTSEYRHLAPRQARCLSSPAHPAQPWPQSSSSWHLLIVSLGLRAGT